jgi:hypothetical protein
MKYVHYFASHLKMPYHQQWLHRYDGEKWYIRPEVHKTMETLRNLEIEFVSLDYIE